jgi:hypothetical protein
MEPGGGGFPIAEGDWGVVTCPTTAGRVLYASGGGGVEAMSGLDAMAAEFGVARGLHINGDVSNCKTGGTGMEEEAG